MSSPLRVVKMCVPGEFFFLLSIARHKPSFYRYKFVLLLLNQIWNLKNVPHRIPHGNNNHKIRIIVRKNAYSVSETWLSIECGICGCCITACNVGIRDCFFFLLSTLLKFISLLHVDKNISYCKRDDEEKNTFPGNKYRTNGCVTSSRHITSNYNILLRLSRTISEF